jgi:carboxypeptidase family protein
MRSVAIGILGALSICTLAWGQFEFGSVFGVVKDQSQSPVPGASVEIRSATTNVARQFVTTAAGEYNFLSLPPDKYKITVRHEGFREQTLPLEISVGQRVQADISLVLGSVNEQVTVQA